MSRYDERDLPTLKGTVSMTKVKNALRKVDPNLRTELKNIRINGQLQGCSGFIVDDDAQRVVYINTEGLVGFSGKVLYRIAASTTDYAGGRNRYTSAADLIADVLELLDADARHWEEVA